MRIAFCVFITIFSTGSALAQKLSFSHGQRELERILNDRLEMRGVLPHDDVIVRWVKRKLSVGSHGETVVWDAREPEGGYAQHAIGNGGTASRVCVTSSPKVSGRDKWYLLVFELHNLMHPQLMMQLRHAATSGAIDRKEFANAILNHEYERFARTNKFFIRYPIPDATKTNAPIYVVALESKLKLFDYRNRAEAIIQMKDSEYGRFVLKTYQGWHDDLRQHASR